MASRFNQFATDLFAVSQDIDSGAQPLTQARAKARFGKHKAQRGGHAAIYHLEIALKCDVASQVQLTYPCRVAAASKVFEEKCEIEVAILLPGDPQRLTDLRADPTTADAMAGRLPLRQIKGIAQRTQKRAQP